MIQILKSLGRYRLASLILCGALTVGGVALAQTIETLRNSDIVTMVKAGLGAELIVQKVETTASQFDTNTDALSVLKAAGVPDSVIAAMLRASSARTAPPPQPPAPTVATSPAPSIPTGPLAGTSGRPVIVVEPFAVSKDLTWPYDAKQLHQQVVLILKTKGDVKNRYDIVADKSEAAGAVYTLSGEIVNWRAGNRATRLVVGLGAGRETAEIRFWLTDEKGSRLLERTETIRAAFIGNAVAGSVGQLAEPFAAKLADRLEDVRLAR